MIYVRITIEYNILLHQDIESRTVSIAFKYSITLSCK